MNSALRIVLVLHGALGLVRCGAPESRSREHVGSVADAHGISERVFVLSAAHADSTIRFSHGCGSYVWAGAAGVWVPTPALVQEIDGKVHEALSRLAVIPGSVPEASDSSDWYRQYLGILINGKQIIVVNGIHEHYIERMQDDWMALRVLGKAPGTVADELAAEPVMPCDVGELHFVTTFDVPKGQLAPLDFPDRSGRWR